MNASKLAHCRLSIVIGLAAKSMAPSRKYLYLPPTCTSQIMLFQSRVDRHTKCTVCSIPESRPICTDTTGGPGTASRSMPAAASTAVTHPYAPNSTRHNRCRAPRSPPVPVSDVRCSPSYVSTNSAAGRNCRSELAESQRNRYTAACAVNGAPSDRFPGGTALGFSI
jgi:hypothetical protein